MECNKEEAIRAKDIAEKKMKDNDFEGARKIAKRAQSLYPELENILQLLTICDVHCSSKKMLFGYEKDWYEVLQIERFSDDLTAKKQYRRLALFLHPDKNRFPGAEAAFKLICEANAVLSDPTKKSLYDNKMKFSAGDATVNIPTHQLNKNPQFNNKHKAPSMASNGFSGFNLHQAAWPSSYARKEEFWTACPFCKVRYKYHREFVNRSLQCQNCLKVFVAYEVSVTLGTKLGQHDAQSTASKAGLSQPSVFPEKDNSNQSGFKMNVKNDKGCSELDANSRGSFSKKKVQQEPGIQTGSRPSGAQTATAAKSGGNLNDKVSRKVVQRNPRMQTGSSSVDGTVGGDLKAKEPYFCNANLSCGDKKRRMSNGDVTTKESGDLKNKSKKQSSKQARLSIESDDSSHESDTENVTRKNFTDTATDMESGPTIVHYPRRSVRKRQQILYEDSDDDDDDDDIFSHCKSSQARKLAADSGLEKKDILDDEGFKSGYQKSFPTDVNCFESKVRQMGKVHNGGIFQDKDNDTAEEFKDRGKTCGMSSTDANAVEIQSDSGQDSSDDDADLCSVPDPEFSDFDKNRDESLFSVNQIWAFYDTEDDMPRFYGKVNKIVKSPFRLNYTWLEADLNDEADKRWTDKGQPVGCGTYKLGNPESTTRHFSISHQMYGRKWKKGVPLNIYPREGETWAIFKDWDITCSKPGKRKLKYEIVEVLSDFVSDSGIKVCYLYKIKGFVSLFHKTTECESFLIGPKELYKFSHLVPCFKMTGSEREGVPKGSFELDPASLPLDPNDLYYPSKEEMKCGI